MNIVRFLVFLSLLYTFSFANSKVIFTQEELDYIKKHPVIKVSSETDWPPYDFVEDGKPIGYDIDYLALLSEKIGIKFQYVGGYSWAKLAELFIEGKIDLLHPADKSKRISEYADFSSAILQDRIRFITRKDFKDIQDSKDIEGLKIALPIWMIEEEYMKKVKETIHYDIVKVDTDEEAIKAVNLGFADVAPVYGSVARYFIRKGNFADLKIQGFIEREYNELYIATQKTSPLLGKIVQKAINSISISEVQQLQKKWFGEEETDHSYILKIIFVITFVILFIMSIVMYWNYLLKKQVTKQISELRNKDTIILQQSKHAAMGELIANIAHQWRQPLANLNGLILNFDYYNENNKLNKETISNYINQIEELSLHMSNTIEDFSNFFSPQKEKKIFKINTMIEDIKNLLKFSFIKNNIKLLILEDKDITIETYYAELLQILLIIINNSKDAFIQNNIQNPQILINVEESTENIIIKIEDNAGGIPFEIVDRIFEPYFTTKDKFHGTGLGLHIVKTLLENSLNGNIEVVNTKKGAKFTIKLKK